MIIASRTTPTRPGSLPAPPTRPGRAPARGRKQINLAAIDLNLLVSLDALMTHCNVTRAAQQVGLSQPAMSRALSRLRAMFNDDLLVRSSKGLVRTDRGDDLHARLSPTLATVRELVAAGGEDGDRLEVRVAMPDHQAAILLPGLIRHLDGRAKDTVLLVEPLLDGVLKRLEAGQLGIAIGQIGEVPAGFFRRSLYRDSYCCLLRRDHPVLPDGLDVDGFLALRHAVICEGQSEETGREGAEPIYDALARILPERTGSIVMNNLAAAAMTTFESDLVLVAPRRVATRLAAILPLRIHDLPEAIADALPPLDVALLWHERSHRCINHAWLRGEIASVASAMARENSVPE